MESPYFQASTTAVRGRIRVGYPIWVRSREIVGGCLIYKTPASDCGSLGAPTGYVALQSSSRSDFSFIYIYMNIYIDQLRTWWDLVDDEGSRNTFLDSSRQALCNGAKLVLFWSTIFDDFGRFRCDPTGVVCRGRQRA